MTNYAGPSSYPRYWTGPDEGDYATAVVDQVISMMDDTSTNIYRMSIYDSVGDTTRDAMITHFLENCSYQLCVCPHHYPPHNYTQGEWNQNKAWVLDVADTFSSYASRLWIELANEPLDTDLHTQCQTIVTAVRDEGYTNKLVCDRMDYGSSHSSSMTQMATVTDPDDEFYTGEHYYFTSGAWSTAESRVQSAISLGCKIFNTEIGADYNEYPNFSQSEVDRTTEFMENTKDLCSNTVWMRYGLENWATYLSMGLLFPAQATPKTFTFDARLQKTVTKSFTFDAYPKLEQTKEFTLDGYLIDLYTKTFSLDGYLQGPYTKEFTLDSIVWTPPGFLFDALLKFQQTKTFTVDGWLQKTTPGTFTYDTVLLGRKAEFTFDGFLSWLTATVSNLGLMESVIKVMEQENIGTYCFEAGCVEPGCDNIDVPLRKVIRELESAN